MDDNWSSILLLRLVSQALHISCWNLKEDMHPRNLQLGVYMIASMAGLLLKSELYPTPGPGVCMCNGYSYILSWFCSFEF